MPVMQLTFSSIFVNAIRYRPMSNKRFTKGIPQSVFEYRDQLVSDFFLFYEMRYDEIEVLKVVKENLPTETPTAEQMAKVLMAAKTYWTNYIDKYGLSYKLIGTLENKIRTQWESMASHQNRTMSRRRRKSSQSKTMTGMNNSSTN